MEFRVIRSGRRRQKEQPKQRVLFLGEEYDVELLFGERNSCKRTEGLLTFTLKDNTRANYENYIAGWYRREARKVARASVARWLAAMASKGYEIDEPRLKLFDMVRAWGRCYYTKGLLTLNLKLFATPISCIDYIILHELCHFIEPNHSKRFYGLIGEFDPDFRAKEEQLRLFARGYELF